MRELTRSVLLALSFLILTVTAVAAHEGEGEEIAVEPSSLIAGGTVVLAGSGLEPDDERVIVLAGGDLTVDFGTVTTNAEGAFQMELIIPSHLPGGVYELRAIGDETLTAELSITAAAGGPEATQSGDTGESVIPRDRSALDWGVIGLLVLIAAVVGALLVWRAERFSRATST